MERGCRSANASRPPLTSSPSWPANCNWNSKPIPAKIEKNSNPFESVFARWNQLEFKVTATPFSPILQSPPKVAGEEAHFGEAVASIFESGRLFYASYTQWYREVCFVKLRITIALLLAVAPSLAYARPKTASAHMRPQLFRDRTPRSRLNQLHPHEVRLKPLKNPPPPPSPPEF